MREAATPSEPQRVRLLLPGLTLRKSTPEETPPELFYSADPFAYVFHLLSSLRQVPRDWNNPCLLELRHLIWLWKKDGRARLRLEEETTFYEHTAVANTWQEIGRQELKRMRVIGIRPDRHSAEPHSRLKRDSRSRQPKQMPSLPQAQ